MSTELTELEASIYAADDINTITTDPIPEWGGVVLELRSPDAEVRASLLRTWTEREQTLADLWPTFLWLCAYDPKTDEKVFTAPDAVERLKAKNGLVIQKLGQQCHALMGIGQEAYEEGKDGSSSTTSDSSSTD